MAPRSGSFGSVQGNLCDRVDLLTLTHCPLDLNEGLSIDIASDLDQISIHVVTASRVIFLVTIMKPKEEHVSESITPDCFDSGTKDV